jgi:hypothetical protein
MEMNQICPECGETHIKSLGYNYDLGRVFYECSNCEVQGGSEYFEDPGDGKERFSVAVFESEDDSNAEVIEGGLPWEDALDLATELHQSGLHYGVEIIDDDPDNMEPIVWIKTSEDSPEN